ncbi:MAG TPA: HAD-IIIA family hydrolase, partial [Levilinea sp.]|nr:HAD-IIIA family hydrolase [Levilinea sp.]
MASHSSCNSTTGCLIIVIELSKSSNQEFMRTRKAVFLDLQGTLGGEGLGNILEFAFFPGAIEAIRRINHAHLLAILVTNQSHVAKGLLTMAHFWRRIAEIKLELAGGKAQLDAVYCCPHATQHLCTCQKPQPGMVLQAKRDFHLELDQCYVVGDSGAWDMALAKAVGSKAILVRTGL